ncbi:MAG: phosphorothioated DNA-binding restriction endonuclease [Acidimicrobiales bacterium]
MTWRDDWLRRISGIKQWKAGGERAPHKPLLLLYLFGLVQRSGSSEVTFVDAEKPLGQLLAEFGPPRPTQAVYPFHHLQSDGFWTVTAEGASDPGPSVKRLRATHAAGRLDADLEEALREDPELLVMAVHHLLDTNWPESLHADICQSVGLDLSSAERELARARLHAEVEVARRRDRNFRQEVLVAYEYRCAMCGWDGRLDNSTVGLDAAHVRWWASGGPDSIDNGLCLCTLHHKLLDLGAMGLTSDHRVTVSQRFVGRGEVADRLVTSLAGAELRSPQAGVSAVADTNIVWHAEQVFQGRQRQVAAEA